MKLLVVLSLFFVDTVLTCQWVCVDKHNNIKKYHFDKRKLKVKYSIPAVEVPVAPTKRSWKYNDSLPEVTLRMPEFEVEPLEATCKSKEFTRTVQVMTAKTKCSPRDTIVDIIYLGGGKVVPKKVSTKLCTGVCSSSKTCLSQERRNVSLPVRIMGNGNIQCATVMIPEDTKCKCDCDMKQSDCMPTQIFDKKFCKCKCINEEEYLKCVYKIQNSSRRKYKWNKDTCLCQCLHEKICTTGTFWNRNECKCVRRL